MGGNFTIERRQKNIDDFYLLRFGHKILAPSACALKAIESSSKAVKISTPSPTMANVCSNWAEGLPSSVLAVQPSASIFERQSPALIMGSMVKTMPRTIFKSEPLRP